MILVDWVPMRMKVAHNIPIGEDVTNPEQLFEHVGFVDYFGWMH